MSPLPVDDDALIQSLRQAVRALPDVPAWATERALAVWRAPAPAPQKLLPRVLALLRFDSLATPATALSLRGNMAMPRQLLFSAGGHDLDLRVTPSTEGDSGFSLKGQLLGPAREGEVSWWPDAAGASAPPAARARIDEEGEFVLSPLPAGRGVLRLQLDGAEVELPPFDPADGAGAAQA